MPLIISVSNNQDHVFDMGSIVISRILNSKLQKCLFEQDPNLLIMDIERKKELSQLIGDAAMLHPCGNNWLEALSSWRHPLILLASPNVSGNIPGSAAAYVCLCKSLSIPLIGILQLGGEWDLRKRKLDGLPWCGHISNELLNKDLLWDDIGFDLSFLIEDIKVILKKRINKLGLKDYFIELFN